MASSSLRSAFSQMRSRSASPRYSRRASSTTSESRLPVRAAWTRAARSTSGSTYTVAFARAISPFYALTLKRQDVHSSDVRYCVPMRLALAGDTMLGRAVATALWRQPPESLVDPELAELTRAADLFVLNLECCISERGKPVPKVFNFRAPPAAVETMLHLGVDCVTLANNHALDYGPDALLEAGARLVAGTSAHVFQGVADNVLYDLGDFLDDYARDPLLRNDLGLLFLVELEPDGPRRIEAVPLKLEFTFTGLARGDDAAWIRRRFRKACAELGTEVAEEGGRLVIER